MNKFKEVLERLKTHYDISGNKALAERLGVNYHTLTTWIRREKVPYEILEKISQNENISLDWLLTGNPQDRALLAPEDYQEVNLYEDVYASAGYGATNGNIVPKKVNLTKLFLESLNVNRGDRVDIIRVTGNSMQPLFNDGEYVVVERVDSLEQVKNGNTVIANVDGELYIKKISKEPFSNKVMLLSQNKEFKTIELTADKLKKFNLIGIVRGKYCII